MNEAIGLTLLHFLWEGAAIALLLGLVLLVVREAWVRYGAACIALAAMAAAFGVTLAMEAPHTAAGPFPRFAVARALPAAPSDDWSGGIGFHATPPAWVAYAWMVGVLLLAVHRLGGWLATRRIGRAGNCAAADPWPARFAA